MKSVYKHFKNVLKADLSKVVKFVKENYDGEDKVDWFAIDSENDLDALQNALKDEYGIIIPKDVFLDDKGKREEIEKQSQEIKQAELKAREKEEKKLINDFYAHHLNLIDSKAFDTCKTLIESCCKGGNDLIIEAPTSVGKTNLAIGILQRLVGNDFVRKTVGTTHIDLIRTFWENRFKKILLLDDCGGLWDNKKIVEVLKQATREIDGKKIIDKGSVDYRLKDVNSPFEVHFNLIILTNKIPNKNDESIRAVFEGRCITTEIKISHMEMMKLYDIFAETIPYKTLSVEQRREIIAFIKENSSKAVALNLATPEKVYKLYLTTPNWKEIAKKTILHPNPSKELALKVINEGLIGSRAVDRFKELVIDNGMENVIPNSKSSFYRIRAEIGT